MKKKRLNFTTRREIVLNNTWLHNFQILLYMISYLLFNDLLYSLIMQVFANTGNWRILN